MNIAVNTRLLLPGKLEGLGRFSYEVLKRITRNHPEYNFTFFFDRKYSDEFLFSDNITPVVVHPQARHPLLWYLFFDWGVTKALKQHNSDLFFSPDGWLSLRTDVPSLPVIHDLNFFHNPEWIDWAPKRYYNYFFPRFINRADRIATVSEFSKKDIEDRFNIEPELIDVVYNGSSDGFRPLTNEGRQEVKKKYSAGKEYFLFVGLVHPRKNLTRIIKAFNEFKKSKSSDEKLLIVGSTKYMSSDVIEAFENSPYKKDILFLGRIPDTELKKLTASAMALVYASLFEGFGIPILEAMACNTTVITSDITSMPEVGGEAVVYVDPYSVESIKEGMLKVHSDEKFRLSLIQKAKVQRELFNWERTATLVWQSIEKVLESKT